MGLTEKKKRDYMLKIITNILNTNISLMYFNREISVDDKSRAICNKSIRQSKLGLKQIQTINHIEILQSLFEKLVYGKESYYAMCGSLCSFDKIKYWDNTEKGFQEFLKLEEEGRQKTEQEFEEMKKQREFIKQAQEEGKKVEMVFDNETKKIKPVIIEENNNA